VNGIPVLLIGGKKESGKSTVAKVCEEKFGAVVVSFAAPMKRFGAALGMPLDNLWGSTSKRDEVIETPEFFKEMPNATYPNLWHNFGLFGKAYEHLAPVFAGNEHAYGIVKKWCWSEWSWVNGYVNTEPHPFTCRHALQTLGTECGRSINPNCWGNYGLNVAFELLTGEYDYTQLGGLVKGKRTPPKMVVIDDCRFPNELVIGKREGAKAIFVERPSTDSRAGGHASETSLDLIPGNWWDASVRNDSSLKDLQSAVGHKLNALGFTAGLQNSI